MHEARLKLLVRQAQSNATSARGLRIKVQALRDLCRNDYPFPWAEFDEETTERFRETLLTIIDRSQELGSFEAQRAGDMAVRLLARLDGEPEDEAETFVPIWRNPDVDPGEQLGWLALNLTSSMACALGWRIDPDEWRGGSARCEWLNAEAAAVLASGDPRAAADGWLRSRLDAMPEGVPERGARIGLVPAASEA